MMESKKRAAEYPTMEERQSEQQGNQTGEKLKKQIQYKNLEKEWDSIQTSKPEKKRPTLRRSSTEPRIDVKALQLLDNSPRNLMSALQQHGARSPLMDGTSWNVRTNDLAILEVLRERREAFKNGELKGRRLFHDAEGVSEMMMIGSGGEEIMCINDWDISGQESDQVRSIYSYNSDDEQENAGSKDMVMVTPDCWYPYSDRTSSTSSSSFLCKECIEKEMAAGEAEKEEVVVVMASVQEDQKTTENGVGHEKRWRISTLWIALAMFVFVTSIILGTTFKSFGNRHEMILVPT